MKTGRSENFPDLPATLICGDVVMRNFLTQDCGKD